MNGAEGVDKVIAKPNETISTVLAASTSLPDDMIRIIREYGADTDFRPLIRDCLRFDKAGHLTNPKIRALYKEAFMSFYCKPGKKTVLLLRVFGRRDEPAEGRFKCEQIELAKIFEEIAQSGYRLCLDNVELTDVRLFNLNFSNASLRSVSIRDSTLFQVDVSGADLTDAVFENCILFQDFSKAIMTGTKFETSKILPYSL